jgi:hypothetical protein
MSRRMIHASVKERDTAAGWNKLKIESTELYDRMRMQLIEDKHIFMVYVLAKPGLGGESEPIKAYDAWKRFNSVSAVQLCRDEIMKILANLVARGVVISEVKEGRRKDRIMGGSDGLVFDYVAFRLSPNIPSSYVEAWIGYAETRIESLRALNDKYEGLNG